MECILIGLLRNRDNKKNAVADIWNEFFWYHHLDSSVLKVRGHFCDIFVDWVKTKGIQVHHFKKAALEVW